MQIKKILGEFCALRGVTFSVKMVQLLAKDLEYLAVFSNGFRKTTSNG